MTISSRLSAARTVLGLGKSARMQPRVPLARVPSSIAIIMDGNGRWARSHGLPTGAGHRAGVRALKEVVRRAGDMGVRDLTVFSFSTENWNRPRDEVEDLMGLFSEMIDREVPELHAEGVQIRFIGRRDDLDAALRARIDDAEALTAGNTRLRLFIAMNYGGRQETPGRRGGADCARDHRTHGRRLPRGALRSGSGRSGAGNSDQRRAAPVELPALAVGLLGALFRPAAVARLRRRRPRGGDCRLRGA